MVNPVAVLASVYSHDLTGLRETADALTTCIATLRRQASFRSVARGGIGGIEIKVSDDGRRWVVHAHLALDVRGEVNWQDVKARWRTLTHGSGRFGPGPDSEQVRDPDAFARYATENEKHFPNDDDSVNLGLFEHYVDAVRGRRLFLSWGTARKPTATRVAVADPPGGMSA